MMGLKRLGCGTTGNRVHHRCFHLKVIAAFKKFPHEAHYLHTFTKGVAYLGINDEIDISLPVADFHISEAVEFFWKRAK